MLKEVREKKGVTIAELIKRTGISRQTIYLIEKGHIAKPETLFKIAIALDADINDIR